MAHPGTVLRRAFSIACLLAAAGCNDSHPAPDDAGTEKSPDASRPDASTPNDYDANVPDATDATVAPFVARLVGDVIVVDVRDELFTASCGVAVAIEKRRADGSWGRMQDDRYPSYANPGYYFEGAFVGPSFNEGCDAIDCHPLPPRIEVARAQEYVRIGEKAAPEGIANAESPAPIIEARPFSGRVRITLKYAAANSCGTIETEVLELDVPKDGVCCPHDSCSDNCADEDAGL